MNKKIQAFLSAVLLICAMIFSGKAYAGNDIFDQGTNLVNLGIGFGSPYVYSSSIGSSTSIPPVHVSLDHGITDKFGIGGLIGYTSTSWDESSLYYAYGGPHLYSYKYTFSYVIVGIRGTYHFITTDKYDVYGGAMLGYNIASKTFTTDDPHFGTGLEAPSVGGLALGLYVGGRYMFSDRFGAFAELGYSIAFFSVGVTAKF